MNLNPLHSIRTSMTFFFTVLILSAGFIFFGISLTVTQEAVSENSKEYTKQLISQVNSDIDSYINYMENISTIVSSGADVREYLSDEKRSEEEDIILYDRIAGQFGTILNMREDIYNIGVVGENGKMVLNRGISKVNPYFDLEEAKWYKKAVEADGLRVLSSSHVQNIIEDEYKWVVTLSKVIRQQNDKESIGVMFVDLNYRAITDLCKNIELGKKGYVFLMGEDGKIIYHPKQQLIYSGIRTENTMEILRAEGDSFMVEDGRNSKLYTMSKSEKTNWTVVGVANINELVKNRKQTQMAYTVTGIILLLLALTIAYIFSSKITNPITELRKSMKKVEKGDFTNVRLIVKKNNEIGMLRQSFNIMTEELQNLMEDKVNDQKLKYKLELKALHAQINPHFLYNTLDSIVWMAEMADNSEVVIMTSALAKLLRQSINNEEETVTIRQEIEYVKSYLTIQKMRYKEQLSYDIQVEEAIYSIRIVKLILQPLVENAIYHGIKYRDTMGKIIIRGYEKENNIIIQIIDDGIGMDSYTLARIFQKKERKEKTNGVGVENVNKRIKLYYGEGYGLQYESQKNKGTTVSIIIPKQGGSS